MKMFVDNNLLSRMMNNWQQLNVIEREIIAMLIDDNAFYGSYTALTEKLNRRKDHVSAVRRAAISLKKRGLITIYKKHAYAKAFKLYADWQEKLAYNTYFQTNIYEIKEGE